MQFLKDPPNSWICRFEVPGKKSKYSLYTDQFSKTLEFTITNEISKVLIITCMLKNIQGWLWKFLVFSF